jgi:hypothetical protein
MEKIENQSENDDENERSLVVSDAQGAVGRGSVRTGRRTSPPRYMPA